ncbi:hypothetical protein DNTS_021460 [Danionella cerebrum]|uniref:Cytochrome P450 n=1 Tax=Danionella cerebrum TaxID=2873325 RepID=A0A553R2M7_9TELE|nr:hypothetical protein DNTS_021460 [Danionella translucida]
MYEDRMAIVESLLQLSSTGSLLGALLLLLVLYSFTSGTKKEGNEPPGPKPLPLLGNLLTLDLTRPFDTFFELSKTYGNVFQVFLGPQKTVVLVGYKTVKEALVNHNEEFGDRRIGPGFRIMNDEHGILFSNGENWKEMRRFALSNLRDFGMGKRGSEEKIIDEIHYLKGEFDKFEGKAFDTTQPVNYAVSNIISSIVYGSRFEYTDPRFKEMVDRANENVRVGGSKSMWIYDIFPWLGPFLKNKQIVVENIIQTKAHITKLIDSLLETLNPGDHRGFVDSFLIRKQNDEKSGKKDSYFHDENLMMTVMNLFVAGTDTTGTTLRWGLMLMAKYPQIQDRVQEEIDRVIGGRQPVVDDRKMLPYTDAVIHETQRMANIVPLSLPHVTTCDVTFKGYFIQKDTTIVPLLTSVLKDEDEWEKPNSFYPEHFLDEKGQFVKRDAFIPFSAGRRICLGESLARMELFLFFTSLLQCYRFTTAPGVSEDDLDLRGIVGITLNPSPHKLYRMAIVESLLQLSSTGSLLGALLLLLVLYLFTSGTKKEGNEPPGPKPLPLLGNLLTLDLTRPFDTFFELSKTYGNVFQVFLGPQKSVVLVGYKTVKEALVNFNEEFGDRQIGPSFKMTKDDDGKAFDTFQPVNYAVSNIISSIVYGSRFEYTDPWFIAMVNRANENVHLSGSTSMLLYNAFPWLGPFLNTKRTITKNRLKNQAENIKLISELQETLNPHESRSFVDSFLIRKQSEEESSTKKPYFHMENLLMSVINLFGAGTDTTGTTLRWGLMFMAKYPQIQDRVQEEIDRVIGGRQPVVDDRKMLPYTDAVIHETQRMADIAPLSLPHVTTCDVTFKGYFIKKGTTVIPLLTSVLKDEDEWEKPNSFYPEHFLDEKGQFVKRDAFMPFSAGILFSNGENWKEMRRFALSNLRDFGMGKRGSEEKIIEEIHYLKGEFDKFEYTDPRFTAMVDRANENIRVSGSVSMTFYNIFPWLGPLLKSKRDVLRNANQNKAEQTKLITGLEESLNPHDRRGFKSGKRDSYFHQENLLACVGNLFAAGTDTTGTTLRWALMLMAKYPLIQSKVQEEIDRVIGGRQPVVDDRKMLPYTDAVIHETQRIANIVPLNLPHTTTRDVTFKGYHIQKGAGFVWERAWPGWSSSSSSRLSSSAIASLRLQECLKMIWISEESNRMAIVESLLQLSSTGSLLGALLLLLLVLYLFTSGTKKEGNEPPGPKPLPLLGNLLTLDLTRPFDTFIKLSKTYGNVFQVYLGAKKTVVLVGYKTVKDALVNHNEEFGDRKITDVFRIFTNNHGIVFSNGENWREMRRFALSNLRDFGMGKRGSEEKIIEEIPHLKGEFDKFEGKAFDTFQPVNYAVSNIISSIVYGSRFEYTDPWFIAMVNRANENIRLSGSPSMLLYNAFPWLGPFLNTKRTITKNRLKNQAENIKLISELQETLNPHESRSFVDSFLIRKQSEEESSTKKPYFHMENLLMSVINLFGAGTDTTGTTLRWGLMFMAKYPQIQDRVQEEIDRVIGGRQPVVDDRKMLPYTDAVIHETQRMADIAPLSLPHVTTCDVTFKGYFMKKGTTVIPLLTSVLKDEDEWEKPNSFYPEHFLDEKGQFRLRNRMAIVESLLQLSSTGSLLGALLLFLVLYLFTSGTKKEGNEPPGPKPLPLLGNLLTLDLTRPFDTFFELSKTYGNVFQVFLGPQKSVVLVGYKTVKEALVNFNEEFGDRQIGPSFKIVGDNHGILFSNGENWKEMRRFALSNLRDFGMGKRGSEEKIIEEIHYLKGEFDNRFEYTDPRFTAMVDRANENIRVSGSVSMTFYNIFPWLGPLLKSKRDVLRNANQNKAEQTKLITGLEESLNPHDRRGFKSGKRDSYFHQENLLACVGNLFAAGTDTTGTTLRWALMLMAKYPLIQSKVQEEIDRVIGGRQPVVDDRKMLPYTDAVIHETQRIANIVPLNLPHTTTRDVTFKGYHIQKDLSGRELGQDGALPLLHVSPPVLSLHYGSRSRNRRDHTEPITSQTLCHQTLLTLQLNTKALKDRMAIVESLLQLSSTGSLLGALLLLLLVLYLFTSGTKKEGNEPPGPKPLPLLGNLLTLDLTRPFDTFIKLSKTYGNVFQVYLGAKKTVVLVGYKTVKDALVNHNEEFGDRKITDVFRIFTNNHGIVFSNGENWREMRRFALSNLRDFGMGKRGSEEKIIEEIPHLKGEFDKFEGKAFDTFQPVNYAVSNIISSIVYGSRFEYTDPWFIAMVNRANENIRLSGSPSMLLYNAFPWLGPFLNTKRTITKNRLKNQAENIKLISELQETLNPHESRSFVDSFLIRKQSEEESSTKKPYFHMENLLMSVINLFGAGTDTTGTTLRWGLMFMAKYPQIQDRVQEEINRVIGGRQPVADDRKMLPYTDAVIHETQRMADIAPLSLPHVTTCDVTFKGYFIKKGTTVIPLLTSVLKDEDEWEKPNSFYPEHFLDEMGQFVKRDAFMPFSAGRRACLGESLARMELFLFFTSLLQCYRFTTAPGVSEDDLDLRGIVGITLNPSPHKLCAIRRS